MCGARMCRAYLLCHLSFKDAVLLQQASRAALHKMRAIEVQQAACSEAQDFIPEALACCLAESIINDSVSPLPEGLHDK